MYPTAILGIANSIYCTLHSKGFYPLLNLSWDTRWDFDWNKTAFELRILVRLCDLAKLVLRVFSTMLAVKPHVGSFLNIIGHSEHFSRTDLICSFRRTVRATPRSDIPPLSHSLSLSLAISDMSAIRERAGYNNCHIDVCDVCNFILNLFIPCLFTASDCFQRDISLLVS